MNPSRDGDDEDGGNSLMVQLYLDRSDAGYHTLDDGKVNRGNVTDDSTNGFIIQITMEKVIHGKAPNLATFIGFHFRFRGINEERRFRYVQVTIRFEDVEKPLEDDPEVVDIWPDGDYVWSETNVEVEAGNEFEAGVEGGHAGVKIPLLGKWRQQQKFVRGARARLSGEKVLRKRKSGDHKNAVLLTLSENEPDRTGVLGAFRAGILLERKSATAKRFRAHFDIEARADFRYAAVRGVRDLFGRSHVTAPVTFDADHNHFGRGDVAGSNSKDNSNPPTAEMVREYGDAVSWTQLLSVRRVMARDQGQWKEVAEAPRPAGEKKEG